MSTTRDATTKNHLMSLYLTGISLTGFALLISAFIHPISNSNSPPTNVLILLIAVATLAQLGTFSSHLATYEIGSVIALATGALFGPAAFVLITAASTLTLTTKVLWGSSFDFKKFVRLFGFNHGMFSIAGYVTILLFSLIVDRIDHWLWFGFSWLVAGLTLHTINVIVLSVMAYVQGDYSLKNNWLNTWKTDWLNIVNNGIGAGLFATAVSMTGSIGVIIFTFPLVLMLLSVQIILRDAEAQQQKLEKEVVDRTSDLQEANVRLQSLLLQKNRFLSILSHDMKTPLTAIRLYGQMLKKAPALNGRQKDKIASTILDSETALTALVMNVLDVEGMQADTAMVMTMEPFDWAAAITSTVATVELQAERKAITLKYVGAESGQTLYGDQNNLRRVAQNLLSNAVKYTPENGRIQITLMRDAISFTLKVADSGYGIPADQINAIFKPYHRVEQNNQYAAGTGLGLSVVKMIVEAHGGEIKVESMVDEGSTFIVVLPHREDAGNSAEIKPDDAAIATPPQLDTQPSSPHPQPDESAEPMQTHTPVQVDASP